LSLSGVFDSAGAGSTATDGGAAVAPDGCGALLLAEGKVEPEAAGGCLWGGPAGEPVAGEGAAWVEELGAVELGDWDKQKPTAKTRSIGKRIGERCITLAQHTSA
jgi:hypothetical protein